MNGWFLALIIMAVLGLGIEMAQHGKKKEGKHSFWVALIAVLIQISLTYMAIQTGF